MNQVIGTGNASTPAANRGGVSLVPHLRHSMGYLLVHNTSNKQTGRIPVTWSPRSTCATRCPFFRDECYAEKGFHTRMVWNKVDEDGFSTVVDWDTLCHQVSMLPFDQLWRHNIAGDTPPEQIEQLVEANRGKRGFTYTAYDLPDSTHHWAKSQGFTINRSCWSAKSAIASARAGVHSVFSGCSVQQASEVSWTEDGIGFLVCPHKQKNPDAKNQNCANCGLCYDRPSNVVIVFPIH